MECNICNSQAKSNQQLVKHIRFTHGLSAKEYYDLHVKEEGEGLCLICSKKTRWEGISIGYRLTCSHKCGGIYFRDNLRNSKEKYNSFVKKVSDNMKDIWDEREQTGEKEQILSKAGKTTKQRNLYLTKRELKDRYGWMNKLDLVSKQKFVDNLVNQTFTKFWANATEEEKQEIYNKRINTKIELGQILPPEERDQYEIYRLRVRFITEKVYNSFKEIINPLDLPRGVGKGFYALDHKYSISEGYKNNLPPEVLASPFNLQILTFEENSIKNSKSSITKEELLEKYSG